MGTGKTLTRIKEDYLINLLEETKRLIIATGVMKERLVSRYQERLTPDRQMYARSADEVINMDIEDSLLTALMVVMGYRLPAVELYSLENYVKLCDWLGEKEEDGNQKWEGG